MHAYISWSHLIKKNEINITSQGTRKPRFQVASHTNEDSLSGKTLGVIVIQGLGLVPTADF